MVTGVPDIPQTRMVTGVPYTPDEDGHQKVREIIHDRFGLRDINILRATRTPWRNGRPSIVKVQLESVDEKVQTQRGAHPATISMGSHGTRIFFHTSKSHEQRQISCRASSNIGQVSRMGWGVCSSAPHSHCAVSTMPIHFLRLFRPQCSVRRRKIMVCSCLSSFFILSFLAVQLTSLACHSLLNWFFKSDFSSL